MSAPSNPDIASFKNCVAWLEAGLDACAKAPGEELVRDGCIHRFEVTYELSHRALKLRLEEAWDDSPGVWAMSFADLVRAGSALGLLRNGGASWERYRAARSAARDLDKAAAVFAVIPDFRLEARFLLDRLQAQS